MVQIIEPTTRTAPPEKQVPIHYLVLSHKSIDDYLFIYRTVSTGALCLVLLKFFGFLRTTVTARNLYCLG